MSFSEKCMRLEIIPLRKITQTSKNKHHMFSLMRNLGEKGHESKRKSIRDVAGERGRWQVW
jgi:hypothetical protein